MSKEDFDKVMRLMDEMEVCVMKIRALRQKFEKSV